MAEKRREGVERLISFIYYGAYDKGE